MRDLDDTALERRLREVLADHLGALPLTLTADALTRRRSAKGADRRFGRRRGMTLLAAAALFLVGGVLAVGSGVLRRTLEVVVATASPSGTSAVPSESATPPASPIPVAGPGGAWIRTGPMVTPRDGHDVVRLLDGRVLAVGGSGGEFDPATAELYDPMSGTWSATGSMLAPLYGLPPTLLLDGRVLVGDEVDGHYGQGDFFGYELYDPATGTWTATGRMVGDGPGDTPTVLRDGRVLAVGEAGAQVYDPASGIWTATGKMNDQGYETVAALMLDGKVLLAGGRGFRGGMDYYFLDSAQVYDPATDSWTAIANMHAETRTEAAFLQPDGKVLVLGSVAGPTFHAELYDPAAGTWTELPGRPGIRYGSATMLSGGAVLVTGLTDAEPAVCTADLYDPETGSLTTAASTWCGVGGHTLLVDGTILKADRSSSELYVPAGVSLPPFSFPDPVPTAFLVPTAVPTLLPPAVGPVPPNARSWTVTVDNRSSEPATLFVIGDRSELVGSATPNVVPAGTTVQVTFLFPANFDGWIHVNPGPDDDTGLLDEGQIGIPGKILIGENGEGGWLSP